MYVMGGSVVNSPANNQPLITDIFKQLTPPSLTYQCHCDQATPDVQALGKAAGNPAPRVGPRCCDLRRALVAQRFLEPAGDDDSEVFDVLGLHAVLDVADSKWLYLFRWNT